MKNIKKRIDKYGLHVTIKNNFYSDNYSQFKGTVNNFLENPSGKILSFLYEFNDDCDSVEVSIEPRGFEDGFDIRFDGDIVATEIYEEELLNVIENKVNYFAGNY